METQSDPVNWTVIGIAVVIGFAFASTVRRGLSAADSLDQRFSDPIRQARSRLESNHLLPAIGSLLADVMAKIPAQNYIDAEPEERQALVEDRLQQVGLIARVREVANLAEDLERLTSLRSITEKAASLKAWGGVVSLAFLVPLASDLAMDEWAFLRWAFIALVGGLGVSSLVTLFGWIRERNLRRSIVRLCNAYEE